jgi:ribosome-binding protein aMBF1 (putative translation factor)
MRGRMVREHLEEKMRDREFRKAWHGLEEEFEVLESIIRAREKAGLTQEQLAKRIGTKQPALSRLERGGFNRATVETLRKIAEALDVRLVVRMEPKKPRASARGR